MWKPVPGFEGRYEVSDGGEVRSLDRVIETVSRKGKPYRQLRKGRTLRPGKLGNAGHRHVVLDGRVDRTVHSLVLESFIGPCPPGMEARHLNDDPMDNRLENLCWGTRSENSHDSIRNEKHFHAGLTHCKRGHELTPENTQRHANSSRRSCLACRRERQAIYNQGGRLVPEGFCPNGHPKTPENRITNGPGRTRCKVCATESRQRRNRS
jgi:hypothetical protein